jgi:hypothetical protein
MAKSERIRLITPMFRVIAPDVFVKRVFQGRSGDSERYACTALFSGFEVINGRTSMKPPATWPEKDQALWSAIIQGCNEIAIEAFKKPIRELDRAVYELPFHRGEEKEEEGYGPGVVYFTQFRPEMTSVTRRNLMPGSRNGREHRNNSVSDFVARKTSSRRVCSSARHSIALEEISDLLLHIGSGVVDTGQSGLRGVLRSCGPEHCQVILQICGGSFRQTCCKTYERLLHAIQWLGLCHRRCLGGWHVGQRLKLSWAFVRRPGQHEHAVKVWRICIPRCQRSAKLKTLAQCCDNRRMIVGDGIRFSEYRAWLDIRRHNHCRNAHAIAIKAKDLTGNRGFRSDSWRWRDVVEATTVLVVGDDEHALSPDLTGPQTIVHIGDQLLTERHHGGRVLIIFRVGQIGEYCGSMKEYEGS